jgi:prepilin-type N-terminal cleavage/methylation domain-containing protein
MARPVPSRARPRSSRSGFSLIELLVVLAMAAILMAIGFPALMNVLEHYKVRSSAQSLMMLGREARYEAIKQGVQVSVVPDPRTNMFYVVSVPPPTPPATWSFPGGPAGIPNTQRITVWEAPRGVTFTGAVAVTYNTDGSATGAAPFPPPQWVSATFSFVNQPSSKVVMTATATGKLAVQ